MTRKSSKQSVKPTTTNQFIFCSNWKCDKADCARNRANQPWNEVTIQRRWTPEDGGDCKGYTEEGLY